MDERRAEQVLGQLIAWGLIEETRDGEIRGSRKWAAKLQAAAEKLNILEAKNQRPVGNPLMLAVGHALANENLTTDEDLYKDAVAMLVTLELSRMTPDKRAQYGFDGLELP